MQRNHIGNFLGFLLVLLTISLAGAGFLTYHNLSNIVTKLESDDNINSNLIQYKEILVNLHHMENQVELFDLTGNADYIDKYNESISLVFTRVDSLNTQNPKDGELLLLNDSLSILINEKTSILNQLIDLKDSMIVSELDELEGFISEIAGKKQPTPQIDKSSAPIQQLEEEVQTEITTEKLGFFKRLFAKKPQESASEESPNPRSSKQQPINEDSLLSAERKSLQSQINTKVNQLKSAQQKALKKKKALELDLMAEHFDIQNRIMDLVTFLESRESVKMNIQSVKAKKLAAKTNQQITIFFILATLLLSSTVIVMVVYVRRNISYQQLLRESKNAAEILGKAKERFFANMSHEIRTPMNAISGFTKVLLKSDLDTKQKEQVNIIHKSSQHLLHLLNDILDFSKLQAEKLNLENVSFSIAEVCEESIHLLRESAESKNLQLTYELNDLPEYVQGDPHRLRQILLNLLNNGIKYTDTGEVKLKVGAHEMGQEVKISFEISDTGIGISKDQQFRLFREFEQANQSSFSKGTGLGLAITKRLVMLHKGKINLESREGEGTRVFIDINYPIAEKPATTIVKKQPVSNFEGLHVLIADDEPFNTKLLATILSQHNITFDEALDGEEALSLANAHSYDLLLLDLKMPKHSGWEVASAVSTGDGPNKNTPKIALTATVTRLDQQKGNEAGFDHMMRKPFDESELFEIMASLVEIDKKNLPNAFEPNLESLRQMGDEHFVEDMVMTFVHSARDGMKRIYAAYEASDFPVIAMMAHRIVAPARHFKAQNLVDHLKALEHQAESEHPSISKDYLREIEVKLNHVIDALENVIHQPESTK